MTTCYHPEKRLLYVHIPKCAGTTLGGNWDERAGEWHDSWLNDVLPGWSRKGLPNGHQPVRTMEHWTTQPVDFWARIIVTIRNPYAQQVSQYRFWRARALANAKMRKPYHDDDRFAASMAFHEFVQDPRSNGPNAVCGSHWKDAGGVYRWWCLDREGKIPQNLRIVKVEDLQKGMEQALDGLGAAFKPMEVRNSFTDSDWRTWYTRGSARAVRDKFSWSLANYYPELTGFVGSDLIHDMATAKQ